ncbi:MAG TPA: hypothetical protein VFJ51_04980 [Nitrososphaeraceae archaeon]|nr:hypothetical protein [Nitrososphaeraceae archaeon]
MLFLTAASNGSSFLRQEYAAMMLLGEAITLHEISVRIFTSQDIQKQIKNQDKNDGVNREEAGRKRSERISMRSRTRKI